MAEKTYEVIAERFVGRHGVYNKGSVILKKEIHGDEDRIKLLLNGQKNVKRNDRMLPEVKAVLKETTSKPKTTKAAK